MKGFHEVEEDWIDFLDWAIAHPYTYTVNFKKPITVIDQMGYSECLYYFIAIGIDSGGWYVPDLAEQLGLSNDQIQEIYEAYSMPVDYMEDSNADTALIDDFNTIYKDMWSGPLNVVWKSSNQ